MAEYAETIGGRIVESRENLGLSQKELAKLVGVSSILSAPVIMENPETVVVTGFFLCFQKNVNKICISRVYHN